MTFENRKTTYKFQQGSRLADRQVLVLCVGSTPYSWGRGAARAKWNLLPTKYSSTTITSSGLNDLSMFSFRRACSTMRIVLVGSVAVAVRASNRHSPVICSLALVTLGWSQLLAQADAKASSAFCCLP